MHSRIFPWLPAMLLLNVLLLAGCPAPTDTVTVYPPGPEAGDSSLPPSTTPQRAAVTLASWDEIQTAIAAQKGKVVVVDLWSTTCDPCKREFPHLVQLHNQHGDKIACMSVSLDYYGDPAEPPEYYRESVEEFLSTQSAGFPHYLSTLASDDVLMEIGAVSVPTVLVYDRDGQLAKMFEDDGTYGDEGFTYADHIAPLVVELAGSAPAP